MTLIDKAEALAFIAKEMKDARQTYSGFGQAQEALRFAEQMLTAGFAALPARGVGVPTEADREWIDARADQLFREAERRRGAVALNTTRPQDFRDYFVVDATLERFAALAPTDAAQAPTDTRPANCRFRLKDEGKPYGRSSCSACGKSIFTGLGNSCSKVSTDAAQAREAALREASGVLLGMMQKCQASMSKDGYDKGLQLMCDTLGAADAAILALIGEART